MLPAKRRVGAFLPLCILVSAAASDAAPSAADTARAYLERQARALGLTRSDVAEVAVSSEVTSRHTGVTHVYLQQRHRGLDVEGAVVNVNVGKDGRVIGAGNRFVAGIAAAAGGQTAHHGAEAAATSAAYHLGLPAVEPFHVLQETLAGGDSVVLTDGGIAARPVEARLLWLPTGGPVVRLAWRVEIEEPGGNHVWHSYVDAEKGTVLFNEDLVERDNVDAIAAAIARPAGSPAAPAAAFGDIDGSSYRVFPYPFESPSDGDRALVTGAADPVTSPFGWHDVDGVPGHEHTRTRGNNVHAYTDVDANGVPDPGSDPDGGSGLDFDFPLDLTQAPPAYRPAAVTNLFYWNNVMHDVTARYGFDEASGNFQIRNYSGAPGGNDDVRAEAQDGSGTNNANFLTPTQNALNPRPRMQMFVWTHPRPNTVTVPSGGAAGSYEASGAAFGPPLTTTGPISATVTLANDGGGVSSTDGCEPLIGFPPGHIALVDRGNCNFTVKAAMAQAAAAAAVIVVNNAPGPAVPLGGADPTILIPSVMVSDVNGALFKAHQPFAATLAPDPTRSINRDSDLDAGVIAHEYGHGISNRLTGGPNINCLSGQEQMGEGWSDWFALNLTTHPSDNRLTARGIGSYVVFEPADGEGIRPTPYSTDLAANPSNYDSLLDLVNISTPHGVGYVWNTMLWEVYWNLVDRYGYNADIYGAWSTGGNNRALQLVMDGLKLQPCAPGFVDGRNAILQADTLLTGGANRCEIWRGFSKRGLGFSASQGTSASRTDGVSAFDLPASCLAATFGGFRPPISNPPDVNSRNAGSTIPVKFSLSGAEPILDSQPVDCATLLPTGEAPGPLASNTGLKKKGNEYHINWSTDRAWEGTCRRLTVRIPAATDGVAYFSFH
jgi:extracellular elastinolytic metalloproteinase